MRGRAFAVVLILCGCQLALLSGVWPGFLSPNEWSRLAATRAAVLQGTWAVDGQLRSHGPTEDLAERDGRRYSDKAPGTIWLAVPVVAAVHAIAPRASIQLDQYACRLALVTSIALLAAWVLSRWIATLTDSGERCADGAVILLLATPFGVYAGMFFAHAWAGGLLLLAAWLLLGRTDGSLRRLGPRVSWCMAGLAGALAATSEYQAAFPAAVILVLGVWDRWRRLPWVMIGVLPPAFALAAYNTICFGAPWSLSHRHYTGAYSGLGHDALLGFGTPSPEALAGLMISPLAGLLFLAPVLLPALVSPVVALSRGKPRVAVLLAATVWIMPLIMAGYTNWHAGASFGPRYLVAVIPFWVLGTLVVIGSRRRPLFVGAALASMVVHWVGRITPPFAIETHWTASTLRGWSARCLLDARWNVPFGTSSLAVATLGLIVTAVVWVALAILVLRHAKAETRWIAVAITVILVGVQLGVGGVTERQATWWHLTDGWFRIPGTGRIDISDRWFEDLVWRVGCDDTFHQATVQVHGRGDLSRDSWRVVPRSDRGDGGDGRAGGLSANHGALRLSGIGAGLAAFRAPRSERWRTH